jgi:hypothetical protein
MRSFEFGYYLEQPISQSLLMTVRALGEFRGRHALYQQQSPEILETLRRVAIVDLQRACPGISYPTIKRALADLKRNKEIRCLGKGRNAEWERIGS